MKIIDDFKENLLLYKDKLDVNLILKALEVAIQSHKDQFRKSGEPYIVHPIRVANSIINYRFDTHTICASLLHDVIEDTKTTEDDLNNLFGSDITNLVIGVTKLSNLRFSNSQEAQLENFRKFILAFIKDIRVLIIKLFDRLDNMRTIEFVASHKQQRIAQETLDIYVPLAARVSINDIKEELEDLCFAVLQRDLRLSIIEKTKEIQGKNNEILDNFIQEITQLIINHNMENFSLHIREKNPYSIWKKMQKQNISFEEVFDIFGYRIILNNIEDCYKFLYILHTNYKAIFNRFKDYISNPKSNNYKSLHTCIILDNKIKIEFQIRTKEMHAFNEYGISSHWNYKYPANVYDISQYNWLKNLLTIISTENLDTTDIYEYSKLELFNNQIFVFTPKGDIVTLPKESTALDFAYSIHSDIGNTCSEVYINGFKKEPFFKLETGQRVEIITNPNQKPSASWLNMVKTGLAKVSIKRYLHNNQNKSLYEQAVSILSYMFEKEGLKFFEEIIPKIMELENIKTENILYHMILDGKINIAHIIKHIYPNINNITTLKSNKDIYIQSKSIQSKYICLATCCYPVLGDPIVGVLLPDNNVEVHHSGCYILYADFSSNLDIIRCYWKNNKENNLYSAKLFLQIDNSFGSLYNIFKIFNENNINIVSFNTKKDNENKNFLNSTILVEVIDINHLTNLIATLTKASCVTFLQREIN